MELMIRINYGNGHKYTEFCAILRSDSGKLTELVSRE
jgi:hypothetical protein